MGNNVFIKFILIAVSNINYYKTLGKRQQFYKVCCSLEFIFVVLLKILSNQHYSWGIVLLNINQGLNFERNTLVFLSVKLVEIRKAKAKIIKNVSRSELQNWFALMKSIQEKIDTVPTK